jgi:hypothetical protein
MISVPNSGRIVQLFMPSLVFRCWRVGVLILLAFIPLTLGIATTQVFAVLPMLPSHSQIADNPTPTPPPSSPSVCGGGVGTPCGH